MTAVVSLRRTGCSTTVVAGRDHDWNELVDRQSDERPCEPMDSESLLFLPYTSGSTGKPKGLVHTPAGFCLHAAVTARNTFNLRPDRNQVYWCTADVGWITGHSYIIYGVLPNRVPTLSISGLTIFALFSLPGWLFDKIADIYTHLSTSLAIAGNVGTALLAGISYGLAACFVVHLMARAYWVGLIGLRRWQSLHH